MKCEWRHCGNKGDFILLSACYEEHIQETILCVGHLVRWETMNLEAPIQCGEDDCLEHIQAHLSGSLKQATISWYHHHTKIHQNVTYHTKP